MNYSKHVKKTPQTSPVPGKKMVENNAGGFTFTITPIQRLVRFLILGTEGGTYYATEQKMTVENAQSIIELIKADGPAVVQITTTVSIEGRAPKNDPAIFVLALCCTYGNEQTKKMAYGSISLICRIGTHLFQFCQHIQDLRGWSRGLRSGVAKFYTNRKPDQIAYQLVKYRQRNGWTHRDVLRLSHPKPTSETLELYKFAVDKPHDVKEAIVTGFLLANRAILPNEINICDLIQKYNLPREAVPTYFLKDKEVWWALLQNGMPLGALVRSLGPMTAYECLISSLDPEVKDIYKRLTDPEEIKKARLHPMAILIALKTYESGKGFKGKLTWKPIRKILDGLDEAFYLAFNNVVPTGKRILIGLDVSGSMGVTMNGTNLRVCEAAAAMCMVTARTEEDYEIKGFCDQLVDIPITAKMNLTKAAELALRNNFGTTDCAVLIKWALQKKKVVDCFIIYTDNETYIGDIHPFQALQEYRREVNPTAKMVIVGMESTGFSIADPSDAGSMDVVGFDTSVPALIADFIRG